VGASAVGASPSNPGRPIARHRGLPAPRGSPWPARQRDKRMRAVTERSCPAGTRNGEQHSFLCRCVAPQRQL
jgi:hypothetical protein